MSIEFRDDLRSGALSRISIAARFEEKWIFCRTGEAGPRRLPCGLRAEGEELYAAAVRILRAETGAAEFRLEPVAAYSLGGDGGQGYGGLFFADIETRGAPGNHAVRLAFAQDAPGAPAAPEEGAPLLQKVRDWLADGEYDRELLSMFEFFM